MSFITICVMAATTVNLLFVCLKLTELHEDSRIFMPTSFLIHQNKNIVLPFRIALMIVLQVVLLPTDLLFIGAFVLGAICYGIGKALGIINDDGDKRLQ